MRALSHPTERSISCKGQFTVIVLCPLSSRMLTVEHSCDRLWPDSPVAGTGSRTKSPALALPNERRQVWTWLRLRLWRSATSATEVLGCWHSSTTRCLNEGEWRRRRLTTLGTDASLSISGAHLTLDGHLAYGVCGGGEDGFTGRLQYKQRAADQSDNPLF